MGIFIYAFTATGKSTLAKKYKNVIDMESTMYKYLETSYNEESKGTIRKINKDWPNNYFNALKKVASEYDYILISDDICNKFLKENNFKYWWIYPQKELKDEYLERCRQRGNNVEFIKWYENNWNNWIDSCKSDELATKHIELKTGEYLEDVLPNLKNMI